MRIERETGADSHRKMRAGLAVVALSAAVLAAQLGRLAESPLAGAVPALGAIGPGKIGQLRSLQLDAGGQPPRGVSQMGRSALVGAPLAYEPFFATAAESFRGPGANGSARDAALLREAIRRNPRSREARVFLMRHAIGAGDLAGAIKEIAVLNRLTAGVTDKLMPGLGAAVRSEKQVDQAVAALKPHPELFASFLKGFGDSPKTPQVSVRLVEQLPKSALAKPEVHALAIKELIRAQAFGKARALWSTGRKSGGLVHSPDFADTKAPPPFNWEQALEAGGVVEPNPGGGMAIDYFGRAPGPIFGQLLTLAPGQYRARLDYFTTGGAPGAISLQLHCAGQAAKIFDQPLTSAVGREHVLLVTFTVPQQCGGQQLTLAGRVQESRDAQQVVVRRLDVEPGGAK